MSVETISSKQEPLAHDRLAYRPMEVAALLGFGRNKIFDLLRSGELASVKSGGTRLIPKAALDRFLGLDEAA